MNAVIVKADQLLERKGRKCVRGAALVHEFHFRVVIRKELHDGSHLALDQAVIWQIGHQCDGVEQVWLVRHKSPCEL